MSEAETKIANGELDPAIVGSNDIIRVVTEGDTFHLVALNPEEHLFAFLSRAGGGRGYLLGTSFPDRLKSARLCVGGKMQISIEFGILESSRIQYVSVFRDATFAVAIKDVTCAQNRAAAA